MKKIIYFALALVFVLSLCACSKTKNEKKDGHDIKRDENLQDNATTDGKENGNLYESVTYATTYEKKNIRMFLVGDTLYYDTGKFSEMTPRCGTLDGYFSKVVDEGEVPTENHSSNFEANGYQNATYNTKEVNIDGEWEIFAKFSETPTELKRYKYCFYIKGRLNNAQADTEIVVLTDYENISLNDVFAPLLSSQYDENVEKHLVAFDMFSHYDEEESNDSAASLGIIGGADGPTAIIVGKPTKTIVIDK